MKQSSKKHELGTAALYCRLSRDDNMDSESNSIQNQREYRQGMSLKAFIWAECNDRKQIDSMIA